MAAFHIIGDRDTVLGYRFAGVTGEIAETAADAREAFNRILQEQTEGILLLTEQVEAMIPDLVAAHRLQATPPFITVIESAQGPLPGRKPLLDTIYEAVGIRLTEE